MKPLSILVVEDNPVIGILLAEVLREMGYDICAIEADEAGAIDAAARYKPDLMIVDAWLRDGSGAAAVEEITRAGPVPHIFVSGDASITHAFRPGAIVLQKPYREKELAAAIERALDTRAVA
jgi:DNA-binding response OmpR family regulator